VDQKLILVTAQADTRKSPHPAPVRTRISCRAMARRLEQLAVALASGVVPMNRSGELIAYQPLRHAGWQYWRRVHAAYYLIHNMTIGRGYTQIEINGATTSRWPQNMQHWTDHLSSAALPIQTINILGSIYAPGWRPVKCYGEAKFPSRNSGPESLPVPAASLKLQIYSHERFNLPLSFLFSVLLFSCNTTTCIKKAPVAEKIPHELFNKRIDNYFWIRLSDEQKDASYLIKYKKGARLP